MHTQPFLFLLAPLKKQNNLTTRRLETQNPTTRQKVEKSRMEIFETKKRFSTYFNLKTSNKHPNNLKKQNNLPTQNTSRLEKKNTKSS